MKNKNREIITKSLSDIIIEGIQEKKGKDIVSIDLSSLENNICDNFIICHGDSNTQVYAIAGSVEQYVKQNLNEFAHHKEGLENSQWVLLDYMHIMVHIFQKPYRDFYKIEELWADGIITRIDNHF